MTTLAISYMVEHRKEPDEMLSHHVGLNEKKTEDDIWYFDNTETQICLHGTLPRSPLSFAIFPMYDWYVANVSNSFSMADLHCFTRDNFTNPEVPPLAPIREEATRKSDELSDGGTHLMLNLEPRMDVSVYLDEEDEGRDVFLSLFNAS
mmetsp:Transcript_4218/g.10426  ORF Transcript_4218/g.10426 Transcript_4218/m.10426 type:complete len:149 (+) Transcript_4218:189-635(+)